MSTLKKHKPLVFLMFAHMSQSKECVRLLFARSVSQHHVKSKKFLPYAFNIFFSMDVLELIACWCSLLYIFCLLVRLTVLLAKHAFTNMG